MDTVVTIATGVALGILVAAMLIFAALRFGPRVAAETRKPYFGRNVALAIVVLFACIAGMAASHIAFQQRKAEQEAEVAAARIRTECIMNRNGYLVRCAGVMSRWLGHVEPSVDEKLPAFIMRVFYAHNGWTLDEMQARHCRRELDRKDPPCAE